MCLPRELDVNAVCVVAFNLHALHLKVKAASWNKDHAARGNAHPLRSWNINHFLWQVLPRPAEGRQRLGSHLLHLPQEYRQVAISIVARERQWMTVEGGVGGSENAAISQGLDFKLEGYDAAVATLRRKRLAMIAVIVEPIIPWVLNCNLRSKRSLCPSIDKRPESFATMRPHARKNVIALYDRGRVRLPVRGLQKAEWAEVAQHVADAPRRLRVGRHKLVPSPPHVFPGNKAIPVEKRSLKVVCVILRPAVAHVS
mmetsp:Transcript_25629/g.59060  ORF Transcript_25629/g.59060 Transcript_25629/m.59060 type:complete len:256 (+) Transcript_25629:867-1634(+)